MGRKNICLPAAQDFFAAAALVFKGVGTPQPNAGPWDGEAANDLLLGVALRFLPSFCTAHCWPACVSCQLSCCALRSHCAAEGSAAGCSVPVQLRSRCAVLWADITR